MLKIDSCPICNSKNLIAYAMKYTEGFPHIARTKCKDCEMVFANPMATLDELNNFYSNYYEKGNFEALEYKNKTKGLFKEIDGTSIEDISKYDKNIAKYASSAVFLDIGFGLGFQLYLAQKLGAANLYGTELDKDAIEFVKPFLNNANLFHGELKYAFYPDQHFDLINLCHVIEHVLNPVQYMEELYRITKKNGILIIATPNIGTWPYLLFRLFNFMTLKIPLIVDGLEHTFIFNKKNLIALTERVGFKVVEHYNEAVNDSFSNIFKSNLTFKKKVLRYIQTKLKINQVLVVTKKLI